VPVVDRPRWTRLFVLHSSFLERSSLTTRLATLAHTQYT